MTGTLQRRFLVLIAAATAAFVCWKNVPGTAVDRAAFSAVVRGFANPPYFISGSGSHSSPWKLRTFATNAAIDSSQAPVIISLGDDLEGFFQSSPPSPIDFAVIFSNMQRLGAQKAASAAVLAWDAPDPIGLMALDKAIGRFESLVMAAPLSRGAVSEPMPPAFRRASIPIARIQGDTSSLPIVNRIPLPGIILGGNNTLAGFQSLDSEATTEFPHLVARWDDRIVLSFPLLCAIQQLGINLDDVEIRVGEHIKLSSDGPILPIDRYGRLALSLKPVPAAAEIPAATLIDGADLFPNQTARLIVLRDDHSAVEPATRRFSRDLSAMLTALSSDTAFATAANYSRVSAHWEIGLLAVLAIALSAMSGLQAFTRNTLFLTTAAFCITAQYLAAGSAKHWLPGIPALSAISLAFLAAYWKSDSLRKLESPPPSSASESTPIEPPPVEIPPVANVPVEEHPLPKISQDSQQKAPPATSRKTRSRRKKRRR